MPLEAGEPYRFKPSHRASPLYSFTLFTNSPETVKKSTLAPGGRQETFKTPSTACAGLKGSGHTSMGQVFQFWVGVIVGVEVGMKVGV